MYWRLISGVGDGVGVGEEDELNFSFFSCISWLKERRGITSPPFTFLHFLDFLFEVEDGQFHWYCGVVLEGLLGAVFSFQSQGIKGLHFPEVCYASSGEGRREVVAAGAGADHAGVDEIAGVGSKNG